MLLCPPTDTCLRDSEEVPVSRNQVIEKGFLSVSLEKMYMFSAIRPHTYRSMYVFRTGWRSIHIINVLAKLRINFVTTVPAINTMKIDQGE